MLPLSSTLIDTFVPSELQQREAKPSTTRDTNQVQKEMKEEQKSYTNSKSKNQLTKIETTTKKNAHLAQSASAMTEAKVTIPRETITIESQHVEDGDGSEIQVSQ